MRGMFIVDFVECRPLILVLLLAGFAGSTWVTPCDAALFKDLRIGAYDNFTRIVFEFNEPAGKPVLTSHQSGQLDIAFPRSKPALVRKVPTKYSNRIKDIHIWTRGDDLVAFVVFNFEHFRYKWFSLSNPPRMVVDVFALKDPPISEGQPTSKGKESPQRVLESFRVPPTDPVIAPTPLNQLPLDLNSPSDEHNFPSEKTNALNMIQFYLVVALIAITILILILLLLMLLLRNRWVDKGPQMLRADEQIRRQDARIASLNEQIQEQLKRYDMED